jgi:hypothetical protein
MTQPLFIRPFWGNWLGFARLGPLGDAVAEIRWDRVDSSRAVKVREDLDGSPSDGLPWNGDGFRGEHCS